MCTLLLLIDGLSCHCPHSSKEQRGNPWGLGHGVNDCSLGTTGWVRKAGNLQDQWEEKRHSDLQAPGVTHLVPAGVCLLHKAPATAQSAASTGGKEE